VIRIERLAAGGDGVGRLEDGRTLFVPRTAPGDLIEVSELRLHKRFARGRVGKLVEEGPGRVKPICRHYERDRCGGCQWQHLDGDRQRAAKSAVIGDALRRLGKLDVTDPEVVGADRPFGYRTKVTLARGKNGELGLHREGEADRIFPLERCELIAPALQELLERVRPHRSMLPRDLERLVLRLDREGGRHLIAETSSQEVWTSARALEQKLMGGPAVSAGRSPDHNSAEGPAGGGALPSISLWWRPEGGSARVVAGGDGRTAYPATVFEQVNPAMGDLVRRWAVDQSGEVRGKHCWDLYAGIGETTAMLVERGATVESIEGDRRAVELAEKHPALRTSHLAQAVAGKVEDLIGGLRPPHLVITNPPRVGMEGRAVDGIRKAAPRRIIYISCDPATLARDVARLGSGWRVTGLKGFDLFPQTAHVETVLVLEAT
jgi:23S rRNA (uracil1939-C5)-methyltransferase